MAFAKSLKRWGGLHRRIGYQGIVVGPEMVETVTTLGTTSGSGSFGAVTTMLGIAGDTGGSGVRMAS